MISSPSPTAAASLPQCYAPIAHSQSNTGRSTQRHTVDSQFRCQGMLIAPACPAGTNIPPPAHPLHQSLGLSPSHFLSHCFLFLLFPTYLLHLQSENLIRASTTYESKTKRSRRLPSHRQQPSRCHPSYTATQQHRAYQSGTRDIGSALLQSPSDFPLQDHSGLQNIKTLQGPVPLSSLAHQPFIPTFLRTLSASSTGKDNPLGYTTAHPSCNFQSTTLILRRQTESGFYFTARPSTFQPYIHWPGPGYKEKSSKNLRWTWCGMTDDINPLRPRTTPTLGASDTYLATSSSLSPHSNPFNNPVHLLPPCRPLP